MRRIYAYLLKERHLDREVIQHFIHNKLIYEDAEYHNIVFVGLEEGECWLAISTIAREIKLSEATVRRAIRELERASLIDTEQRYRAKGGKSSLLFRIL